MPAGKGFTVKEKQGDLDLGKHMDTPYHTVRTL